MITWHEIDRMTADEYIAAMHDPEKKAEIDALPELNVPRNAKPGFVPPEPK